MSETKSDSRVADAEPATHGDFVADPNVNKPKSPWNSLEVAKLAVGLLMPMALVAIGYVINSGFRSADEARAEANRQAERSQKQLEDARQLAQTRQAAVGNFSRFIYERRVRSELLHSALRRHGDSPTEDSKKEVIERKRLYDEAYVNWNANHQANLLLVRQVLGATSYSNFESMVEFRLVAKTFAPIDSCLTRGYDLAIRAKDPRSTLAECRSAELIQRALDCGYAITDELFKLSGPGGRAQEAQSIVDARCPNG